MINASIKGTSTRSELYINKDGIETSIDMETGKRNAELSSWKSRRFDIYHITRGIIAYDISLDDISRKDTYTQTLITKTKENYLGKTRQSKANLNKQNKLHLVGYYVVEIPSHKSKGFPMPL